MRIVLDTNGYSALASGNPGVMDVLEMAECILVPAVETGCRVLSCDGHFDKVGGLVRIAP